MIVLAQTLLKKIRLHSQLMRLDKPIGILLLLWPTLLALWIAGRGSPEPFIVIIFVLGVVVMRSAGCVINDIVDRQFDSAVSRTRHRPLAVSLLSVNEALWLFAGLLAIAFLLVVQLDLLTIGLSIMGLLLAALYPFLKRYTHFPQVVLGLAFGWAVPMAFVALTKTIPWEAVVLFFSTVCWVLVYDTEYAMVDREEDLLIGVKSTAIAFGKFDRVMIGVFQMLTLGGFVFLGWMLQLGKFYYCGVLAASFSAVYQQYLIKNRVPAQCFKAFLNNAEFGACLFLGLFLDFYC